MKKSIEKIENSLDSEMKKKFKESMNLVMLHGLDFEKLMQEGGAEETVSDIKSILDGKTAICFKLKGNLFRSK